MPRAKSEVCAKCKVEKKAPGQPYCAGCRKALRSGGGKKPVQKRLAKIGTPEELGRQLAGYKEAGLDKPGVNTMRPPEAGHDGWCESEMVSLGVWTPCGCEGRPRGGPEPAALTKREQGRWGKPEAKEPDNYGAHGPNCQCLYHRGLRR